MDQTPELGAHLPVPVRMGAMSHLAWRRCRQSPHNPGAPPSSALPAERDIAPTSNRNREAHPNSGVSYVMPVYNEVDYVEAAVSSILAQDYSGPIELVLALAPSTDGTDAVVHRLAAADERITVVDNPGMHIPIGLNRAIAVARHPVVIRVDAHTQLEPDYTRRGVVELDERGAANLGGIMVATGRPGFQAAVARAYNSRLGLGGASYHAGHAEAGPAESAYLGIMRASAVRGIGGFDESLRRGEDWEMNFRLRKAGHLVWLDPGLRVTYWPRDTWNKLARQFLSTGIWRGELTRRLGAKNPLRFFAPPALVVNVILALVVALLQVTGVLSGAIGWVASVVHLGPLAYLGALAVAAVTAQGSLLDRVRYVVVLATMHVCWGAGFIVGALRGGGDSVDTSRVDI